jgi:hypothetical protein
MKLVFKLLTISVFLFSCKKAVGPILSVDKPNEQSVDKPSEQKTINITFDGVADNDIIQVMVYSIEMVYVPQAAFYVGDGTDGTGDPGNILQGQLRKAESNTPFQINSENAITLGGTVSGNLSSSGGSTPADDFNANIMRNLVLIRSF